MNESHLDIDFFRKLASVSEVGLLTTVMDLAIKKAIRITVLKEASCE